MNPVDFKIRKGGLESRYPRSFPLIPGWDVAGVVEAVGPAVPEFSAGDEVMAYARRDHIQWGTYAELVPAPVRTVACKPGSLSWREAASLPLAGLTAWQVEPRAVKVRDLRVRNALLRHQRSARYRSPPPNGGDGQRGCEPWWLVPAAARVQTRQPP